MDNLPNGIIYKVTNTENNKVYIGQTVMTLTRRKACHYYSSRNNKSSNRFYNALRKYNTDSFVWEIIEKDIPFYSLDEREIFYISFYCSFTNGYNSTTGGSISKSLNSRYLISNETKLRMSNSRIGSKNGMYGKIHTKEARDKMSIALKGKKHFVSEETKVKISKAKIEFYKDPKNREHLQRKKTQKEKDYLSSLRTKTKKPVQMIDPKENKVIMNFGSIKEAARYIKNNTDFQKAAPTEIKVAAREYGRIRYGFKWRFLS